MIAIIAACHTETGTRTFESKYHLHDYLCTADPLDNFMQRKAPLQSQRWELNPLTDRKIKELILGLCRSK